MQSRWWDFGGDAIVRTDKYVSHMKIEKRQRKKSTTNISSDMFASQLTVLPAWAISGPACH